MAVLTDGAADRTPIPVRDVLSLILALGGARFAVAHNHPSSRTEPSEADVRVTARLRDAETTVGLRLLDHVIVTDDYVVQDPVTITPVPGQPVETARTSPFGRRPRRSGRVAPTHRPARCPSRACIHTAGDHRRSSVDGRTPVPFSECRPQLESVT
ncbi:JAB domain-containing protein [Nonomuraea sp. NPDC050328]|uniref:JAB domain-containing protein n=1 Tax=Nonomuraea sp. NPDC050328 TaxID=3364361 RepID=UPI0037994126